MSRKIAKMNLVTEFVYSLVPLNSYFVKAMVYFIQRRQVKFVEQTIKEVALRLHIGARSDCAGS